MEYGVRAHISGKGHICWTRLGLGLERTGHTQNGTADRAAETV
jgi:hypothetical protein